MADERQYAYVQFRRGDQAYWDQRDADGAYLLLGEPGVLVQDGPDVLKLGDGVSKFANLPAYGDTAPLTYDVDSQTFIVSGSAYQVPALDAQGEMPAIYRGVLADNLSNANEPEGAVLAAATAVEYNPATALPADPYGGKEPRSQDYSVYVNGAPMFVHIAKVQEAPFTAAATGVDAGGDYSFVNFDAPLNEVTQIEVVSTSRSLTRAEIYTRRFSRLGNIERQVGRLRFTMSGPAKVVLLQDGVTAPLMLFGNEREAAIDPADPAVMYYGPGYYEPTGIVRVTAGKTLYLHRDAILKGTVSIDGDNATVRGRGIISGDHMPHGQGAPNTLTLLDNHGNNTTIEGVTLRGGPTWTVVSWHVASPNISNVKVCNGRVQNDDGIGLVNTTDARVSDCFVRSDDDCLTVKGTNTSEQASGNQWTDMTLWSDRGRALLVGHESKASGMDNNILSDSLVLHTADLFYAFIIQPGDGLAARGNALQRITFRGESQYKLVQLSTAPTGTTSTTGGSIDGFTMSDFAVVGNGGIYAVDVRGVDSTHLVQNVAVTNFTIGGVKVKSTDPVVRVGPNTSGVTVS